LRLGNKALQARFIDAGLQLLKAGIAGQYPFEVLAQWLAGLAVTTGYIQCQLVFWALRGQPGKQVFWVMRTKAGVGVCLGTEQLADVGVIQVAAQRVL
jgi:hypothetical protein